MAIGVINNKTTAVRVIPAIGKGVGDCVEYGGLFGRAPIMPVNPNRRHRACPPWRTLPGTAELAQELAEGFGRGAPGRANI